LHEDRPALFRFGGFIDILHEVADSDELLHAIDIYFDIEGALNGDDDLNPVEGIGLYLSKPSSDA
jgi:hypothetical protein